MTQPQLSPFIKWQLHASSCSDLETPRVICNSSLFHAPHLIHQTIFVGILSKYIHHCYHNYSGLATIILHQNFNHSFLCSVYPPIHISLMHYLTWDFWNVNWAMSLSQSRPCRGSHLTLSIVVKMASNAWHNLSSLSSTLTSLHSSLYCSHSGLPVVLQTMQALLPQGLCTRPVCLCHRAFVFHPGKQVAPFFTRSRLCFNAAFPVRSALTTLLKVATCTSPQSRPP